MTTDHEQTNDSTTSAVDSRTAIRQLVLQALAPVIAKALGYHDKAAARLVTEVGGTWSR